MPGLANKTWIGGGGVVSLTLRRRHGMTWQRSLFIPVIIPPCLSDYPSDLVSCVMGVLSGVFWKVPALPEMISISRISRKKLVGNGSIV